jgi:hypothetical protein
MSVYPQQSKSQQWDCYILIQLIEHEEIWFIGHGNSSVVVQYRGKE